MFAKTPGVSLAALADADEEGLAQAGAQVPSARLYGSLTELLRHETVDIVDICTPPASHAGLILEALNAGAHVLCEKPLVLDLESLEEIRRSSVRTGRVVYSVHNWKFSPQFRAIRQWIREGRIGALLRFELHTLRTAPAFAKSDACGGRLPWRLDVSQAGGGVLIDHGWHLGSLAIDAVGEVPRAVWARLERDELSSATLDVAALCGLEFSSARGLLHMSWTEKKRGNTAFFVGDQGTIFLDDDRLLLRSGGRPMETRSFSEPLSAGSFHPDWFEAMLPEFFHEIEHPESRRCLEEAQGCLQLILGAYRSDRGGSRLVSLNPRASPVRA